MQQHGGHQRPGPVDTFPTDIEGLPTASAPQQLELADGETLNLTIAPVAKRLGAATVRMLAYNGSVPGPTVRVRQGSEIVVQVSNDGDLDTTVHWHGLRLENRFDGVPHETQLPIPVGGTFTYRLKFRDPGLYWYHPHIREDYGQELGLYGNIIVDPAEPGYWPPAHREVVLTLDDLLLEDGKIAPFSRSETDYAAMGRYGNVLLISGERQVALAAKAGEVVRLYLTNTANTRVFDVVLPGARMKLVGGDSGRYEREELIDQVLLAPSERAIVDVLFDRPGQLMLHHRTPNRVYQLGTVTVAEESAQPALATGFGVLRSAPELVAERHRLAQYLAAPPDKTLALVAVMDDPAAGAGAAGYACPMHPEVTSSEQGSCPKCGMKLLAVPVTDNTIYACPMHPEITSTEPGSCPKCGMKLAPVAPATTYACPMHLEVTSTEPGSCPKCGMKLLPRSSSQGGAERGDASTHHDVVAGGHGHHDEGHGDRIGEGIEWEDEMVEVNRLTTTATMRWKLVDRDSGAENAAIDWRFHVGDRVKIRLVNEMESDHPMHHPFHLHGAGRFLVLARDGVVEPNLVWKDTVLLRTGQSVDILFDVTEPGLWMAHCHIAEHLQSGMMFSFTVDRKPAGAH